MTNPRPLSAPEPGSAAPSVLVVEDDVMLRSTVAEFLRLKGFQVVETGDVTEAKRALSARRDIQVVLTDVQMPGGESGTDLARYVQESHPRIPVLLVSGYFDPADIDGFPLLKKPFGLEQLLSAVQALLASQPESDLNGK